MTVTPLDLPGLTALRRRLDEVAGVLLAEGTGAPASGPGAADGTAGLPDDPGQACAELLHRTVAAVAERPSRDRVWLLLVALTAVFPLDDEVLAARRRLELSSVGDAELWLLEWAFATAAPRESGAHDLRLVRDGVVVDVDFTAKHDLQTGIQRVVRRLVPRWQRDHAPHLAVWTRHSGAFRGLADDEEERVLRWVRPLRRSHQARGPATVVVPWRSTVVLPEVPGQEQCLRLASLAQHSGNRVALVGYDAIPVLSADLMPATEPTRFVRYLTLVKHAHVLAGISESAAQEFRGFTEALPAQGLTGPRVVACPLASDAAATTSATSAASATVTTGGHAAPGPATSPAVPEVLVVGSHEPRKNHLAVLHAAEVLWREGLAFRLRFLGAGGWTTTAFDARLDALTRAGRPVVAQRGADDEALWDAYRSARFTVFPSLHEGYGLPVVESVDLGTPAVATSYGPTAELARDGGVLLVDPRDDEALTDAMRRLLVDDALLASLREAALARPDRTWDDYAAEAWRFLVEER